VKGNAKIIENETSVGVDDGVPITVAEARDRYPKQWPRWKEAMECELKSLQEKGIFRKPMECPTRFDPVGWRWVFAKKRNEIGIITKFKARLVAQGFSQRYGIDFEKTYAPVMKIVIYRILVAFGTKYGLEMRQIDFDTAYLNADIDKKIYMSILD
jgi:hypothetical protein